MENEWKESKNRKAAQCSEKQNEFIKVNLYQRLEFNRCLPWILFCSWATLLLGAGPNCRHFTRSALVSVDYFIYSLTVSPSVCLFIRLATGIFLYFLCKFYFLFSAILFSFKIDCALQWGRRMTDAIVATNETATNK